jgi:hypothetical protein
MYYDMKKNIGTLDAIFVQNITKMIKSKNGNKLIKEYVSLIKENKELLKEYLVFQQISEQKYSENLKDYITEVISCLDDINKTKLQKFNDKLYNFIVENKLEQLEEIKDEVLFENIEKLIFSKKSIKSINEKIDTINNIVNYIKENDNSSVEDETFQITENSDVFYAFTLDKFNKKYEGLLNEEEREIFKTIVENIDGDQNITLFESKRKECLNLTNDFLKEAIDNVTKEKLLNVKEKLLEQTFNKDTFISDILSFVELKETLSE